MPVTSLAARLPGIETIRRWSQSLAALDAILSPEWQYRYFSFDSRWDRREELASMRNGSGDEYSIVFAPVGAYARGFDHESEMSPYVQSPRAVWPGVIDDVPAEFQQYVAEPAFSDEGVPALTFCLWRRRDHARWQHGAVTFPSAGNDPDGADRLFEQLDGRPDTYRTYALEYFQTTIERDAISRVYRHEPLSAELLSDLNPELSLADIAADLDEIGYPRRTCPRTAP